MISEVDLLETVAVLSHEYIFRITTSSPKSDLKIYLASLRQTLEYREALRPATVHTPINSRKTDQEKRSISHMRSSAWFAH